MNGKYIYVHGSQPRLSSHFTRVGYIDIEGRGYGEVRPKDIRNQERLERQRKTYPGISKMKKKNRKDKDDMKGNEKKRWMDGYIRRSGIGVKKKDERKEKEIS